MHSEHVFSERKYKLGCWIIVSTCNFFGTQQFYNLEMVKLLYFMSGLCVHWMGTYLLEKRKRRRDCILTLERLFTIKNTYTEISIWNFHVSSHLNPSVSWFSPPQWSFAIRCKINRWDSKAKGLFTINRSLEVTKVFEKGTWRRIKHLLLNVLQK